MKLGVSPCGTQGGTLTTSRGVGEPYFRNKRFDSGRWGILPLRQPLEPAIQTTKSAPACSYRASGRLPSSRPSLTSPLDLDLLSRTPGGCDSGRSHEKIRHGSPRGATRSFSPAPVPHRPTHYEAARFVDDVEFAKLYIFPSHRLSELLVNVEHLALGHSQGPRAMRISHVAVDAGSHQGDEVACRRGTSVRCGKSK